MPLYEASLSSPIGALDVFSTSKGVCALEPAEDRARADVHLARHFGAERRAPGDPHGAVERLARYFEGAFDAVVDLAIDLHGTPFQLDVWRALRNIPVGTTTSYGALANELGRRHASRAVGLANAKNPVMIVVPCHRVIGAGGALTGYAGGLARKAWLLRHEGARAQVDLATTESLALDVNGVLRPC